MHRGPVRHSLAALATLLLPVSIAAQSPAEAWWRHVQVLAHDSLKGRNTGTPEHETASRYLADQFKAAGLQPGGSDGWYQRVAFVETRLDAARVTFALQENGQWSSLAAGADVRPTARLSTGNVEAPIVFAGYGLSLPGANDLAGLDLRGKIVLHYNGIPAGLSAPMQAHGTRSRWAAMQQAGAIGIIAIGAPGSWSGAGGIGGSTMSLADTTLDDTRGQRIGAAVNPALATRLFAGSGIVYDSVVARARRGEPLPKGPLTVALRAVLPTIKRPLSSPNVIGVVPGTDPSLRDEVVVFTAHSDHVGTATPNAAGDSIFNGAMDNASGVATLIETARALTARGGNKRTVAFVAVTAEEKGLLGSRYFAARHTLGARTVVANLNTDMFLPLIPLRGLFVYGYDESDLADDIDAVVKARGLTVMPDPEPQENRFVRSDQYSFIRQGIPALAFKVGYVPGTAEEKTWQAWVREHYHKVSDDVTQPVDIAAAPTFNALYAELGLRVANRATRPAWRPASFFAAPAR